MITKLDCITGLQAARTLANYGIPVIGLADDPHHFSCRTNTCKQVIQTDTSNAQLIDTLITLGRNLEQKAVIIPCSDESIHAISLHRKELEEYYCLLIPEHEVLELFMDKVKFYKYCQLNNYPIPPTFFPNTEKDLTEIISQINFPCIIKPPRADNAWWRLFSEKVLRIENQKQLHDLYDKSLRATSAPIVQEWILGKDSNLNSCTFYYDRRHMPVITFTSRKLRQWPIEAGEITLGEEIRNELLVERTIDLLKGVQFAGVGSLEMKLNDRDGKYYILEANVCRLPLRCKIVEAGGVELLYTMYSEALGMDNSASTKQRFTGAKWISLRRDILSAAAYYKNGELTLKEWLDSIKDEKFYNWRYKNPFSGYVFLYWYDDELKGFLTAQTPLYKYDSMLNYNITELEAEHTAIKMELLKALIAVLGRCFVSIWSEMLEDDVRRYLTSKGFIEQSPVRSVTEYTPAILVTSTRASNGDVTFRGVDLADINNWDIKMLYSDAL